MDKKVELNASSVILVLVLFAGIFIVLTVIYKVFKRCVQYTSYNGWGILSAAVICLWGLPPIAAFMTYYYSTHADSFPKWVFPVVCCVCVAWMLYLIIGTIRLMGGKYGTAVALIRLVVSVSASVIVLYLAWVGIAAAIVALIVLMMIMDTAALILYSTDDDEIIIIHKKGGCLMDQNNNIYYYDESGVLIGNDEFYTRVGGGLWTCSNNKTYYSYRE